MKTTKAQQIKAAREMMNAITGLGHRDEYTARAYARHGLMNRAVIYSPLADHFAAATAEDVEQLRANGLEIEVCL